jgi:hypothetical protein
MAMRMRWLLLLLLCCAPFVTAQTRRPDFSGTWVADRTPEWMQKLAPEPQDVEIQMIIKQSATIISISSRTVSKTTGKEIGPAAPATVWYLDSRDRQQRLGKSEATTRTFWENDTLVTTITRFNEGQVTDKATRRWSLDQDGALVVEAIQEHANRSGAARDVLRLTRK